jgi:hypothetical protein
MRKSRIREKGGMFYPQIKIRWRWRTILSGGAAGYSWKIADSFEGYSNKRNAEIILEWYKEIENKPFNLI